MTQQSIHRLDPKLDLVRERIVDVPRELVWLAWTSPEHVKKWFTPAPWTTVDCEIDLRPEGIFRTVMRSPEGQDSNNIGCYPRSHRERKARLDQRPFTRLPPVSRFC